MGAGTEGGGAVKYGALGHPEGRGGYLFVTVPVWRLCVVWFWPRERRLPALSWRWFRREERMPKAPDRKALAVQYNEMVTRINRMAPEEIDAAVAAGNCPYQPELDFREGMGMYHCPVCGEMLVALVGHPRSPDAESERCGVAH